MLCAAAIAAVGLTSPSLAQQVRHAPSALPPEEHQRVERIEGGIDEFLRGQRDLSMFHDGPFTIDDSIKIAEAQIEVRQQRALALNRHNRPGDRNRAIRVLRELLEQQGENAETYRIMGRIYKDR